LGVVRGGLDAAKESRKEFMNIWNRARENRIKLNVDTHDCALANYVLSCLLVEPHRPPSSLMDEFINKYSVVYRTFIGMTYIVEKFYDVKQHSINRNKVIKELRRLADDIAPEGIPKDGRGFLALILLYIVGGQFMDARGYAENAKKAAVSPLPHRLYGELEKALNAGKLNEEVLNALIKLFYYHY